MWSDEVPEFAPCPLELLVRAGACLPKTTASFRAEVLAHAWQARRRQQFIQRLLVVSLAGLMLTAGLGLPASYCAAQLSGQPRSTPSESPNDAPRHDFSRITLMAWAAEEEATQAGGFEWNLVEAEFALRHRPLRAMRGAL